MAPLPPCRLYGAAMRRAPPLGLGVRLTLPCGWNNAGPDGGRQDVRELRHLLPAHVRQGYEHDVQHSVRDGLSVQWRWPVIRLLGSEEEQVRGKVQVHCRPAATDDDNWMMMMIEG